jgi:hypothetical protein
MSDQKKKKIVNLPKITKRIARKKDYGKNEID